MTLHDVMHFGWVDDRKAVQDTLAEMPHPILADENAARQRQWRQVAQELSDKTAAESARYKRLYEEALDELNELWKEKA